MSRGLGRIERELLDSARKAGWWGTPVTLPGMSHSEKRSRERAARSLVAKGLADMGRTNADRRGVWRGLLSIRDPQAAQAAREQAEALIGRIQDELRPLEGL